MTCGQAKQFKEGRKLVLARLAADGAALAGSATIVERRVVHPFDTTVLPAMVVPPLASRSPGIRAPDDVGSSMCQGIRKTIDSRCWRNQVVMAAG